MTEGCQGCYNEEKTFYWSQESVDFYYTGIPMHCMKPDVFEGICQLLRDKGKEVSRG